MKINVTVQNIIISNNRMVKWFITITRLFQPKNRGTTKNILIYAINI